MTDRRIVLVGPRAAGKSTVGRALAAACGGAFADTDAVLAERVGMAAGEFLAAHGETRFRAVEEQVVAEVLADPAVAVVALGGGAVLIPSVRRALRAPALSVVHLDAEPAVLAARQRGDGASRPPLTELPLEEEVAALRAAREPLYREVRTLRIDAGALDVASCVARIREEV